MSSSSYLVIVESPGKVKTIQKYLPENYKVVSCYGHIRDLPPNEMAIVIEDKFAPKYVINPDKKKILQALKKAVDDVRLIYLATDDDREGEAISWHLQKALHLRNDQVERIVFREITPSAIENALLHPRKIDMDLVHAQQGRRILDRLVGYLISPLLYSKIKPSLSAGRVQSIAVKLIVEKEREVMGFASTLYFNIKANFELPNREVLEASSTYKPSSKEEALAFAEASNNALLKIEKIAKKEAKKTPSAPFTTSTLQQEASIRLGYSIAQTMRLAQQLYEAGSITYMRTDSVRLSKEAQQAVKSIIENKYGSNYVNLRNYKTTSASAQEAHEAIRPTKFTQEQVGSTEQQKKLYQLIWERTMASQMKEAKLYRTTVYLVTKNLPHPLIAKGEELIFPGFLILYQNQKKTTQLPSLSHNVQLSLSSMEIKGRYTLPPARYTEASLVRTLEEKGIGRPSTYVPTIETIQRRGYVIKESRAGKPIQLPLIIVKEGKIAQTNYEEKLNSSNEKLFPTDVALIVTDYLAAHFPQITNYDFTAQVEKALDLIAHSKEDVTTMLTQFYEELEQQLIIAKKAPSPSTLVKKLGVHPKTKETIIARLSRAYGAMLQLGEGKEEKKPRFANLPKGKFLETITLEEAVSLFQFPRILASFEEENIVVKIGRFGPYLQHNKKFYTIKPPHDPYTIDHLTAITVIKEQRLIEAKKIIKELSTEPLIQICKGRFGPYIKTGTGNYKIPKETLAESLTLAQCQEIIQKSPSKRSKKWKKKNK